MSHDNKQTSDFAQALDTRWAAYLGCEPEYLRDGKRGVVARPEWRCTERLPWPLTRGPVCLFTTSEGWVLSVPGELRDRAASLCMGYSFTDLTREGDRAGQEWFEKMGTPQEPERPGVEAYELLSRLVDGYSLRGWSHYVFSYADPARWNATMDSHVGRVTEDRRDIWEQWQRWPGPFCRPAFSQWFEITDAFGYVLEGKLVSAAQLLAHSNEFAWEFGIDTLSEFRRRGFAGAVVNTVTTHIIDRGRVPYYYADAYNKASLHVIRKSGYFHYGDGVVAHAR